MRVFVWSLQFGGALLILSAVAHAFAGWTPLRGELVRQSTSTELVEALAVGWWFGTSAFLAFGAITFDTAQRLKTEPNTPVAPVMVLGASLFGYGVFSSLYSQITRQLALFVCLGVFMMLAAGGAAWAARQIRALRADP